MKDQKEIDAKAIKEKKAVSNDTRDTKPGFIRRGIRVHDETAETWGLKNVPRYEE